MNSYFSKLNLNHAFQAEFEFRVNIVEILFEIEFRNLEFKSLGISNLNLKSIEWKLQIENEEYGILEFNISNSTFQFKLLKSRFQIKVSYSRILVVSVLPFQF